MSTTLTTDPSQLAHEAHRRLARTVNMGPDFGARLERNWTIAIERAHLEACAQAGFTAIRLLVYLCAHQSSSGLDPDMLAKLERIVDDATDLGLAVVISNHRDPQLLCDPHTHLSPTVATVIHLSAAFEGRGPELVFGNPQEWLGTTWDQAPDQEAELRAGFDQVVAWGAATGYPLFLGEFGTSCNADLASRVRWTRFNRRLAEHRGIPWAIWSFGPVFGIYDVDTGAFIPELLAALMD